MIFFRHDDAARAAGLAYWARIRGRGARHFVLVRGVLGWGLTMFVVMGLGFAGLTLGAAAYTPKFLALNAWLWLAGGALFGLLTWHLNEKNFRKHSAATGEGNP